MHSKRDLVIIAMKNQGLRHSLRQFLSPLFVRMIFADDSRSLRDTLDSTSPSLLIAEISLHTDPGESLVQQLKSYADKVSVVVVGDYEEEIISAKVKISEALGFMLKKDMVENLIQTLQPLIKQLEEVE